VGPGPHLSAVLTATATAPVLVDIGRSLREGFFMFWETLWPLILGFGLSGAVQAFVSRESMRRQLGDHVVGNLPAAAVPARVGQHGDAAGRPDQGHGPHGVQRVPGHVRRAAGTDPLRAERVGRGGHGPRRGERAGDMRPADHAAGGDVLDLLPGHRDALGGEPPDHLAGPGEPGVPDLRGLRGQLRVGRVEQVAEHVHAVALEPAREFHAGQQGEPGGQGRGGLRVPGDCVVIGQRDDVQPGRRGPGDHVGRRGRAVRDVAVAVQVGPQGRIAHG